MNLILPPSSPRILTVQKFQDYGFFTGSATAFQLNAAFCIAEGWVETEIGTFAVPTTVTGTFPNITPNTLIISPISRINSIKSVVLHEIWSDNVERLISGTAYITDYENGHFFINASIDDVSVCQGCGGSFGGIYKATIAIEAGFASGSTVGNPSFELALALAADIALQQLSDRGLAQEFEVFEKTIQIGRSIITKSEKHIYNTALGNSARAQFVRNLLRPFKQGGVGKLGR